MSKKYSSDNKMQKLFEGFRKSVSEEGINEDENIEEGVLDDEEALEKHMADKARRRMSQPSTRSYTPSGEYPERPPVDMKALMQSVQDEIRAKGGNVTVKITDKQTGEVTEL